MDHKIVSAVEIRSHVQKLVNEIPEIVEDECKVVAPLPQWQEFDRDGCNWDMDVFRNAAGYETEIRTVVEQVRAKFNLPGK